MQLSVIILNYNVRYFLELCVTSVEKALENIEGEIIVVDNNSSDESCKMMKERFPHILLIENKENLGFPKGNNIGVAKAKGEFLCILNPDTVVAEDTFLKILNTRNWTLNTGIIGCKLIDGTGKFLPESKRGIPTPWVAFTKIFGLYKVSKFFGKYYAQHLAENQTGKVDILVGAFMVMKRELYNKIGGFDENCFMYSDDIDLSYMVLKTGKINYYFHETTVIHYKGESTVRDGKYMKRFSEAMQFFYKKHFSKSLAFDVMMKIGSVFFSLLKMFQGKNITKSKHEHYVIVSENKNIINQFKHIKISAIVTTNSSMSFNEKTAFIFDLSTISFKKAIQLMEQHQNPKSTFKMMLPNSHFIIGSNSSNDRGEVIHM